MVGVPLGVSGGFTLATHLHSFRSSVKKAQLIEKVQYEIGQINSFRQRHIGRLSLELDCIGNQISEHQISNTPVRSALQKTQTALDELQALPPTKKHPCYPQFSPAPTELDLYEKKMQAFCKALSTLKLELEKIKIVQSNESLDKLLQRMDAFYKDVENKKTLLTDDGEDAGGYLFV